MTVEPEPAAEDGPARLGVALIVISMAHLMVILDASIVTVALPSIQRSLHFSASNLVWIINGYTLAFGGLLLLGGRTGDLFGRRRMFMVGLGIFTIASLLGGLATSESLLIGARVLQGIGGAVASPTALALIASTFAVGKERNRAVGVYAAMSGAAGAIGVLLGGVLTDVPNWRWVLFVNVPIGIIAIVAAPFDLGDSRGKTSRLDLPGALLASSGMTLLVFGLIHAGSTSWGDRWTIVSLVAGGIVLTLFVVIESRTTDALLPLSLFRSRSRSTAYGMMLAIGTALFAMFYFLTLIIQDILGFSPLKAGVAFLPLALTIALAAGAASKLVARSGPKPLIMAGSLLASGGLVWMAQLTPSSSWVLGVLPAMELVAAGLALCFVPLTLAAVIGLAFLGTLALEATSSRLTALGPNAEKFIGSAPPPKSVPIPAEVRTHLEAAYVHGYTVPFSVGAGILLGAFLLATFALPRTPATPPPAVTIAPA